MWRVVWIVGEPATGKSTLLKTLVATSGVGDEVRVAYKRQTFVFFEVGRGSRVFLLGPADAYAGANARPGLESLSMAHRGTVHIGVEALLRSRPAGVLVLDLVAYPDTGLEALRRLAEVHALHMPRLTTATQRARYHARQKEDPSYYTKPFECNRAHVARTLERVRAWLQAHAVRHARATQATLLPTLRSLLVQPRNAAANHSAHARTQPSRQRSARRHTTTAQVRGTGTRA